MEKMQVWSSPDARSRTLAWFMEQITTSEQRAKFCPASSSSTREGSSKDHGTMQMTAATNTAVSRYPFALPLFVDSLQHNHFAVRTRHVLPVPAAAMGRGKGRPSKLRHYVGVRTPKRFRIQIEKRDLHVLPVPATFHRHLKGPLPRPVRVLATTHCGWTVRIKQWHETVMFGDGWPLVVEANHIGIIDIITFTLQSELELKFRIYGAKDSMEKNIRCPIDGSTEVMVLLDLSLIMYIPSCMISLKSCQIEAANFHRHYDLEEPPSRFVRIMHGAFKRKMSIPTAAHYLIHGPVPREIKLDMGNGCRWIVVMNKEVFEAQPNHFTLISLDEGWANFVESHGYTPGCVAEFEVIHPGCMKVKIFQTNGMEISFGKCVLSVALPP